MGKPDDSTQLVIEDLALSEALARNGELESDNRWLRETLHEAVAMLHRVNVQCDRLKRSNRELQHALCDAHEDLRAASADHGRAA